MSTSYCNVGAHLLKAHLLKAHLFKAHLFKAHLFKARSLAPAAGEWLRTTTTARVLHVFDQVCNLVNEQGDVLSLVTPMVGNGPFAVVIDSQQSIVNSQQLTANSQQLTVSSVVTIRDEMLKVGPVVVDISGATLWNSRPEWKGLREGVDLWRPRVDLLKTLLGAHDLAAASITGPVQGALTQQLLCALATGDERICCEAAARLAGLGSGLTPAGDDFLMGTMYALWATRPEVEAARWSGIMTAAAVPQTTTLSGAWLRAAAKGEASACWHNLVNALLSGEEVIVATAAKRILATGHTSGADAFSGFIIAILTQIAVRDEPSELSAPV